VSNPQPDYKHLLDVLDGLMRDLDALSRPRTTVENEVKHVISLSAQEPRSILQTNPYIVSGDLEGDDEIYRDIALGKVLCVVDEPRRFFRHATLSTLDVASFEFLNELAGLPAFYIEEWKHTEEWRESRPKLAHALFSFLHHRNVERMREACRKGGKNRRKKELAKKAKRNDKIREAWSQMYTGDSSEDRLRAGKLSLKYGPSPSTIRKIVKFQAK
jgi:hypothetical protein